MSIFRPCFLDVFFPEPWRKCDVSWKWATPRLRGAGQVARHGEPSEELGGRAGVPERDAHALRLRKQAAGLLRSVEKASALTPAQAAGFLQSMDASLWRGETMDQLRAQVAEKTRAVTDATSQGRRPMQDFQSRPCAPTRRAWGCGARRS